MTQASKDGKQTEFSLWLRNRLPDNVTSIRDNDPIDSKNGFITTDIDFIWMNYKTNEWMILEEKTHNREVPFAQRNILTMLHNIAKNDPKYKGLYSIRFENTNPEDGRIYVNSKEVSKEDFIKLLRFEWVKK